MAGSEQLTLNTIPEEGLKSDLEEVAQVARSITTQSLESEEVQILNHSTVADQNNRVGVLVTGSKAEEARATGAEIWKECLQYLENRLKKQSFHTWLKSTMAKIIDVGDPATGGNGLFQIETPNQFVAEWIEDHYISLIQEALKAVTGQAYRIDFTVNSDLRLISEPSPISRGQNDPFPGAESQAAVHHLAGPGSGSRRNVYPLSAKYEKERQLNARYTFESFVVGESNQFAHAAAMAVAEAPGKTNFNPLFIYGGTGLGKTHLAQAIGHYVKDLTPQARVLYVTSEKFTSDFINSIGTNTTAEFSYFYRQVELLVVDDIQFLTGKESTQQQFFHTFNTLHHSGRQIVMTSDRPPKEIRGLEERLLSRFQWGLVTDIQPPDLETRIAILKKRTQADGISLPEEVLVFIANNITSNIRELEGALIRLLAFASLYKKEITVDLASEVLKDNLRNGQLRPVSIEQIQQRVAEHFRQPVEALWAKKKTQEIVLARQVAMYLCRELTKNSLKTIGEKFGGRDHSTVIHACSLISNQLKSDVNFKLQIDEIINSL